MERRHAKPEYCVVPKWAMINETVRDRSKSERSGEILQCDRESVLARTRVSAAGSWSISQRAHPVDGARIPGSVVSSQTIPLLGLCSQLRSERCEPGHLHRRSAGTTVECENVTRVVVLPPGAGISCRPARESKLPFAHDGRNPRGA